MSQPRKRPGRVTPPKPRVTKPKPAAATKPKPKTAAPTALAPPPGRLGLLKVLVQPVLVLTGPDGDVREVQHPTVEIKGVDWTAWAATAFTVDDLEQIRKGITAQPAT